MHREVPLTNSCVVISHLFSAKYYFVFAFVAFVALIGTGLLILTCDQLYNVAANLVSLFYVCVKYEFILVVGQFGCVLFLRNRHTQK